MNDQQHLANIQKEMAENPPETSRTFKEFKILGLENPQVFVDKLVEVYGDKVFRKRNLLFFNHKR